MLIPLYTRIYFAYCICLKRVTAEYNSVIKSDNFGKHSLDTLLGPTGR